MKKILFLILTVIILFSITHNLYSQDNTENEVNECFNELQSIVNENEFNDNDFYTEEQIKIIEEKINKKDTDNITIEELYIYILYLVRKLELNYKFVKQILKEKLELIKELKKKNDEIIENENNKIDKDNKNKGNIITDKNINNDKKFNFFIEFGLGYDFIINKTLFINFNFSLSYKINDFLYVSINPNFNYYFNNNINFYIIGYLGLCFSF